MGLAFGSIHKGYLSLSEAGEPVESQKSVAEVGSKEEAVGSVFIPALEILVGAIKSEEIPIVFCHSGSESKNNTYMHLLVQIIAEFGGNSEVGMHIAGQMIVGGCVASGVGYQSLPPLVLKPICPPMTNCALAAKAKAANMIVNTILFIV